MKFLSYLLPSILLPSTPSLLSPPPLYPPFFYPLPSIPPPFYPLTSSLPTLLTHLSPSSPFSSPLDYLSGSHPTPYSPLSLVSLFLLYPFPPHLLPSYLLLPRVSPSSPLYPHLLPYSPPIAARTTKMTMIMQIRSNQS
jgi:hypothetical protein